MILFYEDKGTCVYHLSLCSDLTSHVLQSSKDKLLSLRFFLIDQVKTTLKWSALEAQWTLKKKQKQKNPSLWTLIRSFWIYLYCCIILGSKTSHIDFLAGGQLLHVLYQRTSDADFKIMLVYWKIDNLFPGGRNTPNNFPCIQMWLCTASASIKKNEVKMCTDPAWVCRSWFRPEVDV